MANKTATPKVEAVAPAKRGRGRPAGAKNKKTLAAEAARPAAVTQKVAAKPVAKAPVAKPMAIPAAPVTATATQSPVLKPVAAAVEVVAETLQKAAATVKPQIEELTEKFNEGKVHMTETFTKVEETATKFAADATARAKTAFEKGSKTVAEVVEFQKGNVEAIVESARIAAKGAQEIAKHNVELGRTSIETGTSNVKKLAAVKSPTEFFALQSEIAKTSLDAFVTEASKATESYMKFAGEVFQPIQNRYAVAVEKVKSVYAA